MANPPVTPLNIEGKEISYFQKLISLTSGYLKEYKIDLSFEGYMDTVEKYRNLQFDETQKAWELSKELNAWSEYFSDIANLIQKIMLNSETEWLEIQAIKSIQFDSDKVSNGNRFSNKENDVIQKRKKRNALKALYDELQSKVSFLERAYYHCKTTYEIGGKKNIANIF